MVLKAIKCPHCGSEEVRKNGKGKRGKQHYLCDNKECEWILQYIQFLHNARRSSK